MLVVVDANAIIKDPILRDRKWEAAKDAIEAGRLRLVLPAVARLEVIGAYKRDREDKSRQVGLALKKSTYRAKAAAEPLFDVFADEAAAYESILDARLAEVGFEVPGPADFTHLEIAERAVMRKPPFNDDGGGYRDTLLWLSAIEQIDEPPFEDLVLLSDDGIFTKRSKDLSIELESETGAGLKVVRSLADIDFPGEYEVGEFDLSYLDIGYDDLTKRIAIALPGFDISRWSPPSLDHVMVDRVGGVELLVDSIEVKKRYGSEVYDLSVDAVADVDVHVVVISGGYDDEVEISEMSGRWNVRVRWRGETAGPNTRLKSDGVLEIRAVDDRDGRLFDY